MLSSMRLIGAAAGAALASYAAAADITIREHLSNDTLLTLGTYSFEGGKTLNLTVGIGSGAFRGPNDPANVIWTLGDRGPNFTCGEAKNVSGVTPKTCGEVKNGRVYPVPSYSPSIYRVMLLDDGTFRVTDVITLKDRDGRPLNGMPNPLKVATTETPLDGTGKPLQQDVHGIDAEGIVRLSDGTFWIGDENGPSMAHFSAEGRMIARHVPRGTEGDYAGARYEVVGSLPAILAKRQANRGIESMAISPDERFLYFIMQNPLANPDAAAFRQARNVRLFKIERATMKVAGEYVYVMDDPQKLPARSVRREQRSAHQRTDGGRPRPADRAGTHRADHQAARNRARRRDRHFRQQVGRRRRPSRRWSRATWRRPASLRSRRRCASTPPSSPRSSARPRAWRCSAMAPSRSSTTTTSAFPAGARRSSWCAEPASRGANDQPSCVPADSARILPPCRLMFRNTSARRMPRKAARS